MMRTHDARSRYRGVHDASKEGVPHALLHNLAHNKVLHERVVFLTVLTEDVPYVKPTSAWRSRIWATASIASSCILAFRMSKTFQGAAAQQTGRHQLRHDADLILPQPRDHHLHRHAGMALWREHLFITMARNAESAMSFFRIRQSRNRAGFAGGDLKCKSRSKEIKDHEFASASRRPACMRWLQRTYAAGANPGRRGHRF